jgi:hypothetical protein
MELLLKKAAQFEKTVSAILSPSGLSYTTNLPVMGLPESFASELRFFVYLA